MSIESNWTTTWYSTASEAERTEFRNWMVGVLKNERVNICFTKKDGTERWLHCTLHSDYLPVQEQGTQSVEKSNTESQSVWDIDAAGWRAFRWDSIREFSFNLGELHLD